MSAKWIRSKQWDDQHIPSWAWPLKAVLRAFSSIPLAVVLLSLVVVYAILASVPVGLLVLGLSYMVYGATLLIALVGLGVAPLFALRVLWRTDSPQARAARFAVMVLAGIALALFAAKLWHVIVWPRLMYDPARGTGVRLFAGFIEQYKSTTLRRLPGIEMSELEFYSWWPLRVVLVLFVINMITATVRRIEFTFPNIGVLTVHTGIVTIALGSMYYGAQKLEGDTLLLAGELGADGEPMVGPPQQFFYDNMKVVLWARQGASYWEQRPIRIPRYNDYNLAAGMEDTAQGKVGKAPRAAEHDRGRTLDFIARSVADEYAIDPDIQLRIVGYSHYAEPGSDWRKADALPDQRPRPVRFADLLFPGDHSTGGRQRTLPFYFLPDSPAHRIGETPVFGIEFVRRMPDQRWRHLTAEVPEGIDHALAIEIPAAGGRDAFRTVIAAEPGKNVAVGDTGYSVQVQDLLPQPPFPIITPGYQNATSSVAVVKVTAPEGNSYTRWTYHRFPEIDQDMLEELAESGMPKRRDADPAIRIGYIDASKLQVYVDEQGDESDAPARAVIRQPGGAVRIVKNIAPGATIDEILPGLHLRLGDRWAHAEEVTRPLPVPARLQRNDMIGTHAKAMLAVEVSTADHKQVVWLPFTRYLGAGMGVETPVRLPDDREISLAFGRRVHALPGFLIQLVDFQMIAYDHRGSPRDYQSMVRVMPVHSHDAAAVNFEPFVHVTKLNAPLQAPFMWSEQRPYVNNLAGLLRSRLNPNQFKFSQAGWDQEGWSQTQKLVDQGQLPRPYATFTILGVGNNPGIHIIALGAIMMSVGIPWAFYLKPAIMRRRKARIAAQVAAGTYQKPAAFQPAVAVAEITS
jgi:hypothetical protein